MNKTEVKKKYRLFTKVHYVVSGIDPGKVCSFTFDKSRLQYKESSASALYDSSLGVFTIRMLI